MLLDAMALNRQALAQSQQLIEQTVRPNPPADPFGIAVCRPRDARCHSSRALGDLLRDPATAAAVTVRVRAGLSSSLNLPSGELPSTAIERYFTEVSPMADRPWLAYTAAIAAALWRAREEQNASRVDLLISLLPLFLDQVARDGGRCQHAFLYTGLPEPAWGRVALNRATPWDQPFSPLADHRWVAAQTAFLSDIESMEQRLRARAKPKGGGDWGGA